jgi:glycosyltransferase involved in cell wall biosynthesis
MTQAPPISAIIPTKDRAAALARTLESLSKQGPPPAQLIVIDASPDDASRRVVEAFAANAKDCNVIWRPAEVAGAAVQRNQGFALATHPVIAFFDDDIIFEPDGVGRLWRALDADPRLGGVNAMISNQNYSPPGRVSRLVFGLLAGRSARSYAGRVLGPAVNLLPEDRDHLPEVVPVEWLNTTCTLYRREALEAPPFAQFFTGYSLMEDLALSLAVARNWKLANARTARIFHDSQPGQHKNDPAVVSRMELNNRHYIMTQVLGRRRVGDYARLALWELFQLAGSVRGGNFSGILRGKLQALTDISRSGAKSAAS